MKKIITLICLLIINQASFSQIVINELDVDTPSIDDKEFVELKSDTPNFSLDGFILVFFNGSTSGGDSSYFAIDLNGNTTDSNGLFLIGSATVVPFPQLLMSQNVIQNGADAVAIYQDDILNFPEMTLATQTNLIDALVYDTSDADDVGLMSLLGVSVQINENQNGNKTTESIQRNNDGTYFVGPPTPRQHNDGSGIIFTTVTISVDNTQYNEGESFDITFTTDTNVTTDLNFTISLDNYGFNTSDFTGNTSLTIPVGQNTVSTTINLTDDSDDEGDEVLVIFIIDLFEPIIPANGSVEVRVVDNDFTVAPFGIPTNPTFGTVASTQPNNYYDSLDGLADTALRQALQDIIADPNTVRAQTYADVIDILKEADENPAHSNQVWLVYTEQGRPKLDLQTTGGSNVGLWNREHTFPRSRGGFFDIEGDEIADGKDVFWTTKADSLRHGNSDAHALRAADGPENSIRSNQHYGQYVGPTGNLGSFYGDVARGVLYMEIRYNGLEIVNGFPSTTGQLGDLATLLDWHRNDPPDDFEMNRNNVVYTWQFNRNPFIDQPDLVEYIWGNMIGEVWDQPLSVSEFDTLNIQIYPNPTTNRIFIKGIKNETQINVFSIEGRQLKTFKVAQDSYLDLNLASGMYLLKISFEGKLITKKIVIK